VEKDGDSNNNERGKMIAKITTIIDTSPEKLWEEIQKPKSLQYVAAPILFFYPVEGTDLEDSWETDKEYKLRLYFLKLIPLGFHKIVLKKIDHSKNEIISNESGFLAKVWNHSINFKAINTNQIVYTDTIEIRAGLLTLFIWLFSQFFYRHRQRKWKRLLAKNTK
jgi:hypothetical protein